MARPAKTPHNQPAMNQTNMDSLRLAATVMVALFGLTLVVLAS